MKTIIRILLLTLIATSLSALEPSKVAYYTNNTSAQNVYVELKDYSSNTMLFRGETFNMTPNDNGIVIVNLQDHAGLNGDWSSVDAGDINTSYVLDIYVSGSLFAQFRLDQLILSQSNASVFDNSGNFNPPTATSSLGTDPNRWEDAYVGGNTLHVGPDSGELNDTEMRLSYNTGTGVINVDNIDVISLTTTGMTVNSLSGTGNRIVSADATGVLSATTVLPAGDLVGTTDTQTLTNKSIDADNNTITNIENADIKAGAAIDATKLADGSVTSAELQYINTVTSNVQTQLDGKQDNITAGSGLSFSTNTLNVGGSATVISNANDLEVNSSATANQVLLSSGTVGTAAIYGALPLGDANSVSGTLPVTNGGTGATTLATGNFLQGNGTSAITATKAIPTGDVLGTTDTQTLTNKSIDADNNTITNIENADIKAGAAIDAAKLADGSVTSTELQYINSVTSNVQTQLDGKQDNITAGSGLSFSTNTLNVGGSATVISNANDLEVNSSATANQVLLSSGTVGTAATYGALPLGDANSVSGTLPVTNGGTGATTLATGNFLQGNGTSAITATKAIPTGDVLGTTDTQTLTNKSIDADNNTITNIENADIKAGAAIDATKLADGSVTSTELQYINSVTSNVQNQLDGKQANLPSQTGNSGQYLTTDGTNLSWGTVSGGSTVSTNSTINGDGSGGSPLGINLSNSNTWSANQTFGGSFLITSNSRIAMTNSDNNARDIRFQEPSGSGSQYIGFRAPSVSQNSNYVFPASIGTAGQVLSLASVNTFGDSATTEWITPAGGGGGGGAITTSTTNALTPIPTTYTDTGVQFTVEANTTYLVRGFYQEDDGPGDSGQFDGRLNPEGGATIIFANFLNFGGEIFNTTTIEFTNKGADNSGASPESIRGIIRTGNAGTLKFQLRENATSSNTVDLDAGGKISLIKM